MKNDQMNVAFSNHEKHNETSTSPHKRETNQHHSKAAAQTTLFVFPAALVFGAKII
mgnify:CR=1